MGSFSFIPDAGFVGTIFVHAIANLMATLAYDTKLKIEPAEGVRFKGIVGHPKTTVKESWGYSLGLSQLHSGQHVNVLLELEDVVQDGNDLCTVSFEAHMRVVGKKEFQVVLKAERSPEAFPLIDREYYRSLVVENVTAQFDLAYCGERVLAAQKLKEFADMLTAIPNISDAPQTKDLLIDLKGQITEAFKDSYYNKWGRHYLPSVIYAHQYQTCNNFKDPGVQHYGKVLFNQCRDLADELFTNLPPPVPTHSSYSRNSYNAAPANMSAYNNANNGCFAGDCLVEMADKTFQMVKQVKSGDYLSTPEGPARVLYKLESAVHSGCLEMFQIGKLIITPWHPVKLAGAWTFPATVPSLKSVVLETFTVHNFVLDLGHVITIEGTQVVTAGHSFTDSICAHPYFGTDLIRKDLSRFVEGTLRIAGVERDEDGLVCGLLIEKLED
jgi:Hint-domain/VWA / Hh  protein intein-like